MEYIQNSAEGRAAALKRALENCEVSVVCENGTKQCQRELLKLALAQHEKLELAPRWDFVVRKEGVLVRRFR